MIARFVSLFVLAGCNLVFPLPDSDEEARPPIDHVVVEVHLRTVTNNADGVPQLVDEPLDPVTVSVVLEDGTQAELINPAIGRYEFDTPNLGYTLITDDPKGHFELAAAVPFVTVPLVQIGHDGPEPPPFEVVIDHPLDGTLPSGAVHTTGVWSTTAATSFEWGGGKHEMFGPRTFLDGRPGDRLYWVQYNRVEQTSSPYDTISRVAELSPALDPMAVNNLAIEPIDVVADQLCARLAIERQIEVDRVRALAPATFIPSPATFGIDAVPRPEIGPEAPMALMRFQGPDNVAPFDFHYFVPVASSTPLVRLDVQLARPFAVPGSSGQLFANYGETIFFDVLAGSEPCLPIPETTSPTSVLETKQLGLVGAISLEGNLLFDDDDVIELDDSIEVSWTVTAQPVDHFQVKLFAIDVVDANTVVKRRVISRATTETTLPLPPTLFEPGTFYFLEVNGIRGKPLADQGDFVTVSYPFGVSTASSTLFRVQ